MIVRAAPTGVASWHLTSLEFAVLLDRIGRDRVPFPFSWTTRARTAADLRAEREAARRRLSDRSLLAAASLLGGPGLQVTACGVESSDRRVRIRAATSYSAIPLHSDRPPAFPLHSDRPPAFPLHSDRPPAFPPHSDRPPAFPPHSDRPPAFPLAVVVVQDPGPTSDTGGTVHVHAVPPERMTHTLTAALPHRRAGRVTPSSVSRDDVVRAPSSHLHDSRGDTDRDRVIHILDGPREGLGEIVVGHGGDGPLEAIAGRRWIDALGDGRYLVDATEVVTVLPATARTIATALDDEIRRAGAVPPVTGTRS
ncbi:ESX secretion-associated protein EspG [Rhodococcus sp. BP-149]|uniref:ESX secretion-associated protein EspG n=1 Tax=unclassified Rhodococcus (in: high G+C Gram-positive bacteria) TaxID=192944 RepID=UPI001C9AC246|nr:MULTISPECIES: ESX secretion-associated protein EspG [unclassified Rhodococcus (in: high G+C Gram-positive bacteria)]MBY6685219.1 ESX secretion-associated protein EspG [Rhodococcus sp. BP-288]MBY6696331.1 ESX secretion-associated protein EspG [Rhodococcus sp. BP-188]MBY6698195.1 ESX secretion-associated protein EspG [Rhodococcus sp. BP-285]MBY6705125.1 ESX secretion-associated protein EspG [Rhodococcus sp. BP-283]MBY6713064.1 ESX secretion-associated protein EspG [Rhodococcus sp. BP-160]